MARRISDSVVVVTGASSGVGRAAALKFSRAGATVAVVARRRDALGRLADHCGRFGGRTMVVPADVRDESAVRSLARQVVEQYGRIDVWINNAAVSLFGRIEETPYEAYRNVIETNLLGYVHGARAVLPYFREQGSGTLVNVSSVVGKIGQPFTSAYVSTKFAIVGLSECLRMELLDAPDVHVCILLPGSIDTPLFQHAANYTGRTVKAMEPVYSAERIADAILELAERPRREVSVGGAPKMIMLMHALAPSLAEKTMARKVDKDHFMDRPTPPTDGNLFQPMRESENVSGGFLPNGSDGKMSAKKLLGAAVLGLVVGLLLKR